ncbi:hypothetical protein D3C76_170360 [compost metagenome]
MKLMQILKTALVFTMLFVQGCDNSRDIQNLAYVTSLGIDYVNGKYVSYVQVLNFTNIARSENVQLGKEVPIWIGVGDGQTVAGSLTEINSTSQFPLFWGHLKSVVMTENVLNKDVAEVYSTLNRHPEVRYNLLVYGTKDKLADILTQKSLFNLSPLDTIMFTEEQMSSQKSFILPINGNHGIANLNEKGNPGFIPSIAISTKNWKEDKKEKGMFTISGAYFFENSRLNSWVSISDLKGMRWIDRKLDKTPLLVNPEHEEHPGKVIMFSHPVFKAVPRVKDNSVIYDITLKVKGTVVEQFEEIPTSRLEQQAAKAIEKELRSTFETGLSKQCDPYQLRERLYRKSSKLFNRLTKNKPFFLDKNSLGSIKIDVKIISTGKIKGGFNRSESSERDSSY